MWTNSDKTSADRRRKARLLRVFSELWNRGYMKKNQAYAWLAGQLGVRRGRLAIGQLDTLRLNAGLAICRQKLQQCEADAKRLREVGQ